MSTNNINLLEIKSVTLVLKLIRTRDDNKILQKELSDLSGVSIATIAKIESEAPKNLPRAETIYSILNVYGIPKQVFDNELAPYKTKKINEAQARAIADRLLARARKKSNSMPDVSFSDSTLVDTAEINIEKLNNFDDASYMEKLIDYAGRIPFVNDAVASYFAMRDPKTSLAIKATLASALVYFISPLDVIPDITPIIGLTDDAGVLMAAVAIAGGAISNAHRSRAKRFLSNLLSDQKPGEDDPS